MAVPVERMASARVSSVDRWASVARRAAAAAVRMRLIAAAADARDGGGRVEAFTAWVGGLREAHRRRPTVGQEFDREGL